MRRQPYPGLRAFDREEADLFFGRESCIDGMVDRLCATRLLAVMGASGSGKSSLVRTGLLDALELGMLARAGSRWAVAVMRPGGTPLANLARALLAVPGAGGSETRDGRAAALLESFLRRGPRSVAEWCRDGHLEPGTNLLLLVDQFEELFRYADYAAREEAEAFAALLLESTRTTDVPIYAVLTMRSEFLGACALIPGLAERINEGLYLTPRMTREEARHAIVGPAGVCDFTVEPALVNRLLNDLAALAPWENDRIGDQLRSLSRRADQLPLMQHVLNRLWLRASAEGGKPYLRLEDYDRIGGLGGAIDAHAKEVFRTLAPDEAALVEKIFRALVTGATVATALRRPCRFSELVALCSGRREAVARVVEAFRAGGRSFLMPPPDVPLYDETVVDISHESLIRQWSYLAGWVEKEARALATWWRLAAGADAYERGEGDLLSGLDLANMLAWWDRELPTDAWVRRHGGNFEMGREFLERSRAARDEKQAATRRRDRRNRWGAIGALGLSLICVAGAGYAVMQEKSKVEARDKLIEMLRRSNAEVTERAELLGRTNTVLSKTVNIAAQTAEADLQLLAKACGVSDRSYGQ